MIRSLANARLWTYMDALWTVSDEAMLLNAFVEHAGDVPRLGPQGTALAHHRRCGKPVLDGQPSHQQK